jgi:ferrochelatase
MKSIAIIANFGGPRSLDEIESFLIALLTDRDVIRTRFPEWLHNWFFTRIARKRALKIAHDYALIGGKSPIFEDTEAVAAFVEKELELPVFAFHRYLTATHADFFEKIAADAVQVFPMFPQFSYATTGSIARFFETSLPKETVNKFQWVRSYCDHPAFVRTVQKTIGSHLEQLGWKEEETMLLFSAHGVPRAFIDKGDPYEEECLRSFESVKEAFPRAVSRLAYQSKFGRGEWLRPYTDEVSDEILSWCEGRRQVVFVPISFTSDHIETLYEIEKLYLPRVRDRGLLASRCPAPNISPIIPELLANIPKTPNALLLRTCVK